MDFLTDEIIESNIKRIGSLLGQCDYIEKEMEKIKELYSNIALTKEEKGKIYRDIYEVELLHLYLKGYEDALTAVKNSLSKK